MSRNVCIIISTCDRYRPVAEWTASRIARDWKDHPPLRFAGLGDERDWMSANLSGVSAAMQEGFRWIYLILDDHPPVGSCRADILNHTLPRLAHDLSAANISLLGWGQRRGKNGKSLGKTGGYLLRNEGSYRWKFSLHPALWSAEALRELLLARLSQFGQGQRTPWNFERHRDAIGGPVGPELLGQTYRVQGARMSSDGCVRLMIRKSALFAFDLVRFFIRVAFGNIKREQFDLENLWLYHYYQGPYPILWSGAMRQGIPSRDFENFLRFTGRTTLLNDWKKVKNQFVPAC